MALPHPCSCHHPPSLVIRVRCLSDAMDARMRSLTCTYKHQTGTIRGARPTGRKRSLSNRHYPLSVTGLGTTLRPYRWLPTAQWHPPTGPSLPPTLPYMLRVADIDTPDDAPLPRLARPPLLNQDSSNIGFCEYTTTSADLGTMASERRFEMSRSSLSPEDASHTIFQRSLDLCHLSQRLRSQLFLPSRFPVTEHEFRNLPRHSLEGTSTQGRNGG